MKKLFALILAVVMCFCLVACGGDDTNTDKNNEAQQETTDSNPKENQNINFVGSWKGSCNGNEDYVTIVINEDGTGTITEGKEEPYSIRDFNWEVKDGMFIANFLEGGYLDFTINTVDGVTQLNYENGIYIIILK